MEKKRLEDVLDIAAHARVRWYLKPDEATQAGVAAFMQDLAPRFPLWDEEHRQVWADVAHTLTGGRLKPEELLGLYEEYILWPEGVLEEYFLKKEVEAEIWAPSPSGEGEVRVESIEHPVEPAELARRCAMIDPRARFVLRGGGRHIRGNGRGWRSLCRHGLRLCPWHGSPVRNRRAWYHMYGPDLWPYVGLVPGSEWHRAPGARSHRRS